jgi:hypothetical protein
MFFRKMPPDICCKQEKDKQMSFSLLVDFMLFCCILAVDAVMTAEKFLRSRLSAKRSTPAG